MKEVNTMQTNQPKISTDDIPDNEVIFVTGTVEFSRIRSRLEGEELKEDNARKIKNGMIADDRPHTSLSISNASVIPANPGALTVGEQYIQQRFYTSPKNPQKGLNFTGKNRGNSLPVVYAREAAEKITEIIPEGELAAGQRVMLTLRCFGSKKPGVHKGISLDGVICEETPKYFVPGMNTAVLNSLQSRGLTVTSASPEVIAAHKANLAATAAASSPAVQAPVYGAPPVYGTQPAYNAPPVYGAQPASAPVAPPVYGAPAQTASAVAAPEYPATPGMPVYPPPAADAGAGVTIP
jgi:hypothetical protein